MKPLPLLVALSLACCGYALATADDPDPSTVLNEARTLAREGKYEEALQKHIWFHENANKDPMSGMGGVRLSFALSYWIELGEKYPKAREALVSIRDKNTKEITEGRGSFEMFHDVSAINHYLKEEPKTFELFKFLHEKYPALAKQCYQVVEEVLASKGEYRMCIGYIPDPLKRFERIREMRELHLKFAKEGQPELKEYAEESFVKDTCLLIEILVGAGQKQEAEKVRERALEVREDPAIREAVEKAAERIDSGQKPAEETVFREPFTLKLHVDKERFYEQEFGKIPFVLDRDVYLFKGDEFGVTLEIEGNSIRGIRYEPDVKKADVTLKFTQEVQADGTAMMLLIFHNNTKHTLNVDALMSVPEKNIISKTSILPVGPGLSNYESWPHPIVQLVLRNIRIGT